MKEPNSVGCYGMNTQRMSNEIWHRRTLEYHLLGHRKKRQGFKTLYMEEDMRSRNLWVHGRHITGHCNEYHY